MRLRPSKTLRFLRAHGASAFVLGLGLGLTALAFTFAQEQTTRADQRRFTEQVDGVTSAVGRRMDTYVATLVGTRGLFAASERVSAKEFRAFVASLRVEERYPGILAIGYTERIPREQVGRYEREVRASDGPADFHVWPQTPGPWATAIRFIEPLSPVNRRAVGFDMSSEAVRREAMEQARDMGHAAASGRVSLVQDRRNAEIAGFLVYVPIYRGGTIGASLGLDERRAELAGWVYAPFRVVDLLRSTLPEGRASLVEFTIYDGTEPHPSGMLYTTQRRTRSEGGRLFQRRVVEIVGHPWTFEFTSNAEFERDSPSREPVWLLAGGLAITALLFAITRAQGRSRDAAEASRERSAFLANAGTLLGRSLDYATTLESVAQLSVPGLADGCMVDLREEDGGIRSVALVFGDPGRQELARRLRDQYPPALDAEAGVAKVLRTGRSELLPRVTPAMQDAAAIDDEHLRMLRAVGFRALMFVPLVARGQVLGVVTLGSHSRSYGEDELQLAEELARLASAAIDNARLYQRAQQAIAARDEFLSIVAHELRTPLTSLHLKVKVLERNVAGADDRLREGVRGVDRQVDRIGRLVESVLDLSRLATGKIAISAEEVDFTEVVREVVARSAEQATISGSTISVELDGPVRGHWDPVRLEQIASNLLSNAIKYGAGKPVELSLRQVDGAARLVVRDRGIGIPPEALERIFGRYERAVSVKHYGGLGLGLYVVRQLTEALGGTVTVQSEVGEGATFVVELPASRPGDVPVEAK